MKERARKRTAATAAVPGRRWLAPGPLVAAAAVIGVVIGAAVTVGWSPVRHVVVGTVAGPSGSPGPQAEGAAPSASAVPGILPTVAPGAPSPYRVTGSVTIKPTDLDCITESVCYAWFTQPAEPGAPKTSERTFDGGVRWTAVAGLPDGQVLSDLAEPSCTAAMMCVGVTQRGALAVTSDGGASWRLETLPAAARSAGWIDQVSCATALECVVHISGGLTVGTFMSTANGGLSWRAATHVPTGVPGGLGLLRCDPYGRCIGAVSAAQGTAYVPGRGPGVVVMRSTDYGLTWSVSRTADVPPKSGAVPGFLMSCGDTLHCLYAGGSGVAITSDGGVTWQRPATAAWQGWTITSVSCPDGLDCSVALAPEFVSHLPVIQKTADGTTWSAQTLPSPRNDPLQYVTLLSCSTAGGCVGLASTMSQEKLAFARSGGFSSGIVQTSPQLVISSLAG